MDLLLNEDLIEEIEESEIEDVISGAGNPSDFPWVLFTIDDIIYGIHSSHVLSIEILRNSTPIVNSPPYTRGVTDFRGDMIPLSDLRVLFNLPDRENELKRILEPKIEAHINWVTTLKECMQENKKFTLATDPHKCAFGQWYDSFKTSSTTLSMHLKKIETPHSELHHTGAQVMALVEAGKKEEAEALFAKIIEPCFHDTVSILKSAIDVFREDIREMLIVYETDGHVKGIIVDEIVSVEYLSRMIPIDDSEERTYIKTLAKRERDDSTILIIDQDFLKRF